MSGRTHKKIRQLARESAPPGLPAVGRLKHKQTGEVRVNPRSLRGLTKRLKGDYS